jgi:WS/DGAT/MGAT family acyltransferase
MSDAEAIMWAVEKDPALRSDFCNLTLLDAPPAPERLDATVARALEVIPRLRERVVSAPLRLVPPEFTEDPALDLAYHVRRVQVPPPGDLRAVLDVAATIAEAPFDRSRPLWEFTLFEGMAGGQAALLQKVHHTISDGVGALKLSLALLDFERDPASGTFDLPPETRGAPVRDNPLEVTRAAMRDLLLRHTRAATRAVQEATHVAMHPAEIPGRAADVARMLSSLQRQALVTDHAYSDVMTERSLRRRFEVHTLALGAVRDTAKRLGGSVNDVFVTGLAAALGRYHARHGSDIDRLRLAMPVSLREHGDESANRFVPARVVVPIRPFDDLPALFDDVHGRLADTKREVGLRAAEGLAGFASLLPTSVLVALTRSQARTIDFAASNLRGSPVPLYLAGSRIVANHAFGPRAGTGLNVTMLGYCDELHLGCNVDPAAVVDVDEWLDDLAAAFRALLA